MILQFYPVDIKELIHTELQFLYKRWQINKVYYYYYPVEEQSSGKKTFDHTLIDDQTERFWEERVKLDMCTVFQLDLDALKPTQPLSGGLLQAGKSSRTLQDRKSPQSQSKKNTNPQLPLILLSFPAALNSLNRLE